ncbi:MAG: hypothetical protein DI538_06355 [Azospira oryzae]|nr:MAG: hypothetical protein DI538_06355 [Azospira oryzae]
MQQERYLFEAKAFAVSDKGIHLFRNKFNYETIPFEDVSRLTIGRGRGVNNWIILFIIGMGLLGFAIYYSVGMFGVINHGEVRVIYVEEIVVPVLPFLIGAYFIYASLKNELMLTVSTIQSNVKRLPLGELIENRDAFQRWLVDKCGSKVDIER